MNGMRSLGLLVVLVALGCMIVGCGGGGPTLGEPPEGGYELTGILIAQFQLPFAVAVDFGGHAYVTNAGNQQVIKFGASGIPQLIWGTQGTGNGEFLMPTGIAAGAAGEIYVGDYIAERTQVFDRTDGTYLRTLMGSPTGGGGIVSGPYGIAYTPGFFGPPRLWITDFIGDRVHTFTGTEGWRTWGSTGGGPGQFRGPCAIAVSRDGATVYVADRNNHRIQQFTDTGNYLRQWGTEGHGPGKFNFPEGVAVTETGHVLVADTRNHRIQRFTAAGVYISKFGRKGGADDSFGFNEPHGIAVSDTGATYICDYGNNTVKIYHRVP